MNTNTHTNTHTANTNRVMEALREQIELNEAAEKQEAADAAARVARIGRQLEKHYFGGPTTQKEDEAWQRIREAANKPHDMDLQSEFDAANRVIVLWGLSLVIVFGLGWLAGWGF